MAHDKRPVVPPQTSESAASGDVGGIPSPLGEGVGHANDRATARRDGFLESDAGGIPPSLPVSPESAAVSPRAAHDKTPSAQSMQSAQPMESAQSTQSAGAPSGTDAAAPVTSPATGTAGDARSRDDDGGRDHSGQDDSPLESLGKAIAEPFRSD